MRLAEAVEQFIVACQAAGLAPRTVKWYRGKLRPFVAAHAGLGVEEVSRQQVRQYIVALQQRDRRYEGHPYHVPIKGGLSPFTVRGHVQAIRRLFSWLVEEGHLSPEANPMLRIPTPRRPQQPPKGVAMEDVRRLIDACAGGSIADRRDLAVILFLIDTGCRVGGLVSLKPGYLDLERGRAIVREKGDKARVVAFTDVTADAIREWLAVRPAGEEDFVFRAIHSQAPLTGTAVRELIKRRSKRAGVNGRVNPHAFRHGFARQYLLNGGDLSTLSQLMGHTDVRITREFYAVYAAEELARLHRKYSPVAHLFAEEESR